MDLFWVLTLKIPIRPLYCFVAITLSLTVLGGLFIYIDYAASLRGDYFQISIGHISLQVPRNWSPQLGSARIDGGYKDVGLFTGNLTAIMVSVYDSKGKNAYYELQGVSDIFKLLISEAQDLLNWYKERKSENATLEIFNNGTMAVGGHKAVYLLFAIHNLGDIPDLKIIFVSWTHEGLIEIGYLGAFQNWEENYDAFLHCLDSISYQGGG